MLENKSGKVSQCATNHVNFDSGKKMGQSGLGPCRQEVTCDPTPKYFKDLCYH